MVAQANKVRTTTDLNGDMFAHWIKHRVEKYGFVENQDFVGNQDFTTVSKNLENGGRSIDYDFVENQDFVSFLVATKKPNGGRPRQQSSHNH